MILWLNFLKNPFENGSNKHLFPKKEKVEIVEGKF